MVGPCSWCPTSVRATRECTSVSTAAISAGCRGEAAHAVLSHSFYIRGIVACDVYRDRRRHCRSWYVCRVDGHGGSLVTVKSATVRPCSWCPTSVRAALAVLPVFGAAISAPAGIVVAARCARLSYYIHNVFTCDGCVLYQHDRLVAKSVTVPMVTGYGFVLVAVKSMTVRAHVRSLRLYAALLDLAGLQLPPAGIRGEAAHAVLQSCRTHSWHCCL